MTKSPRLAVVTDEVSASVVDALAYLENLPILGLEIRGTSRGRFPEIADDELRELFDARERGISVIGVSPELCKGPLVNDSVKDGETRARESVRLGKLLGCQTVTVFSFRREPGKMPLEAISRLNNICTIISGEGLEPVIENVPSGWAASHDELAELTAKLGVRVVWDPANAAVIGAASSEPHGLQGRIARVHVKNWNGHAYTDNPDGDDVSWTTALRWLDSNGFSGVFTIEPHSGNRASVDRWAHFLDEHLRSS